MRGMRRSTDKDDADLSLMRRVAADEDVAVAELYDRFGSLVYRMAYQAMPPRVDTEDAVQEIFVRLWRTAKRYDPKRAALVTWVMLISRRHLVDRLRRSRARVKAMTLDEKKSEPMGTLVSARPPRVARRRRGRARGKAMTLDEKQSEPMGTPVPAGPSMESQERFGE